MKTLELKLKKDVIIVDLPIDAKNIYLSGNSVVFNTNKSCIIKSLNGNYEFLCKGSELTESVLINFIDIKRISSSEGEIFPDFKNKGWLFGKPNRYSSFISAVESKGFYWLKHNVMNFSLYDSRSKTGCHDLEEEDIITKQWKEAEEKTFKNPLIFVKNYVQ